MSTASRPKANSKSFAKAGKEQQKPSSRPSASGSTGSGILASAYNPLLGTFHSLETSSTNSSPPPHNNGRFRNIDKTDDHSGSSFGTASEYDSISNNDSCSGESEDHKEKITSSHQEAVPGSDNDKREKIRQKNERKHQRQREKRAQELHERCSGYLMSRKLESLSQQLVAMGFPSERATMALILNEGRIEESVVWLLEGSEQGAEQNDSSLGGSGNLKIDISEEFARIAEMEAKFKCSRQEVERAVVACEGDLDKTAETLRAHKQDSQATLLKPEETGDPPVVGSGILSESVTHIPTRPQLTRSTTSITLQQSRDTKDFNYTKAAPTGTCPESGNKNLQSLRSTQSKLEWARPPPVATTMEKSWSSVGSSPSVSYSLASSLQVPPPLLKPEVRYVSAGSEVRNVQSEVKNVQMGSSLKEPVSMMQRPQSINAKQNPFTTSMSISSQGMPAGSYLDNNTSAEFMKSNGTLRHIPSPTSFYPNSPVPQQMYHQPQQMYHQPHYQSFVSRSMDTLAVGREGIWSSTTGASSNLTVPPSLGLYPGWGSSGTSVPSPLFNWNTGGVMPQSDYTNIDWTVESTSISKPSAVSAFSQNGGVYDLWSSTPSTGTPKQPQAMRSASSNSTGIAGLQERVPAGMLLSSSTTTTTTAQPSQEWTSPFAGKDLFSIPRQFVTSPTL